MGLPKNVGFDILKLKEVKTDKAYDLKDPFINDIVSFYIYERDSGFCQNCGAAGCDKHHIELKSHMGEDKVDNLILLCKECHRLMHDESKAKAKQSFFRVRVMKNERELRKRLV